MNGGLDRVFRRKGGGQGRDPDRAGERVQHCTPHSNRHNPHITLVVVDFVIILRIILLDRDSRAHHSTSTHLVGICTSKHAVRRGVAPIPLRQGAFDDNLCLLLFNLQEFIFTRIPSRQIYFHTYGTYLRKRNTA